MEKSLQLYWRLRCG